MRELDQDSQVLMAGLKDLQKKYIQRAKRKLRESVRFLFLATVLRRLRCAKESGSVVVIPV